MASRRWPSWPFLGQRPAAAEQEGPGQRRWWCYQGPEGSANSLVPACEGGAAASPHEGEAWERLPSGPRRPGAETTCIGACPSSWDRRQGEGAGGKASCRVSGRAASPLGAWDQVSSCPGPAAPWRGLLLPGLCTGGCAHFLA